MVTSFMRAAVFVGEYRSVWMTSACGYCLDTRSLELSELTARRMRFHPERRGKSALACLPDAHVIRRRSFWGFAGIV